MDFLLRTPFFRLLIAIIPGIVLYQYVELPTSAICICGGISLVFVFISFLIRKSNFQFKFRWLFGVSMTIFLSALSYMLCLNFEKNHTFSSLNEHAVYEVELEAAPVEKAKSYLCKVELVQKYDSTGYKNAYGHAIIYLQKDSSVRLLLLGDRILVDAEFKSPDGVQNPQGFDYARYLRRQGILATAYVPTGKWQKSKTLPVFSMLHPLKYVYRLAGASRNYLLNIYRTSGIMGDEFAVLAALTLGFTDELQPDLLKSYSATGAMHILSVSGLHVGIVYAVILFLLGFMNKKKWQRVMRVMLIILFLWAYAFITGLSPAVLRATLMFSFVTVATGMGWKSKIYNNIFASAFLLLLFNPNLIFDIGFQLSYSAVLSIVFFQPQISTWFVTTNKLLKKSWDLVAVSLAAQLGTAPFVLYYFHQFPNFFLLTNLVAIPLSTIIIYLAIALLIISFVPYLSVAIAFLLKWSLWLLNYLIVGIQNLPWSISTVSMDFRQLIFAFIAIAFLSAYFFRKNYTVLTAGLVSILLVCGMYSFQKYKSLTTSKFIVFADSRVPIINFVERGRNYVFTTDTAQSEKIAGAFWKSNLLKSPEYIDNTSWFNDGFASFHNKRFIILKDTLLKNKTTNQPLQVDYLVLSNRVKPKMEQILDCIQPMMVVADKSISKWYTSNARKVCESRGIAFWSVAEKGAFVVNFK